LLEGLRELGYVPGKTIIVTAVWPNTSGELVAISAVIASEQTAPARIGRRL